MLIKNQVPAEAIVTHTLPLERFKEGFEMAHQAKESVKVVLNPQMGG